MTRNRFSSITSGRTVANADFGELRAIDTRHAPGLRLAEHQHEDPTLNVTFEGGFEETLGSLGSTAGPERSWPSPAARATPTGTAPPKRARS